MHFELNELLVTALASFAATESATVKWPNVNLTTEPDLYLRPNLLRVPPDQIVVHDGGAIHAWLYQVDIYIREGIGLGDAEEMSESLITAFPILREFTGATRTYRITRQGYQASETPIQFIPVEFRLSTIK